MFSQNKHGSKVKLKKSWFLGININYLNSDQNLVKSQNLIDFWGIKWTWVLVHIVTKIQSWKKNLFTFKI
jgi:hypothetical protein